MISSGSKSSPPFDVGVMSSTVTPCAAGGLRASVMNSVQIPHRRFWSWQSAQRASGRGGGPKPIPRASGDCSPERRRMWSDISMSRHRDREISLAPEARLRAPPVCWERWHAAILLHPWSPQRIASCIPWRPSSTTIGKPKIFARRNLDAAEPPFVAVEACEHSGLVCRVQRTEIPN